MHQQAQTRDNFLPLLTQRKRTIAEVLAQNRYVSSQRIAEVLNVSRRTIETHLLNIYSKLASFVDFGDQIQNKRQALIDFLRENL
jgi:DNA-binding CsgD family transcriptional regulator